MLSTNQAAKRLGLTTATLSRYISAGKVPAPKMVTAGGMTMHLWTDEDVEKVRELLPKIANGRKTRYKKKQLAHGKPGSSTIGSEQFAKSKTKAKPKTKKSKP